LLDGNQQSNLEAVIVCFQSVLEVLTREDQPDGWAITQNNLGFAYSHLPHGNRQAHLREAIAHYQAALHVFKAKHVNSYMEEVNRNLEKAELELRGLNQK
jgi:hypothetical protein